MTSPRWLSRLGLVAAGLLLGLTVAELALRLGDAARGADLAFMAPSSYPRDLYVLDRDMAYPNPAFAGVVRSYGYAVRPRFSRWGTRGADPAPGVRTWIGVGDSFTLGVQVEEHETFLARLAAAEGVQVINAGVDGYSTWKAAIRLAQLGRHFPPEVVVLTFFTGNDVFDNRVQPQRSPAQPGLGPGEPGAPTYPVPNQPDRPGARTSPVAILRDHSAIVARYSAWEQTVRMREGQDPNARRFRDELALFTREGAGRVRHDIDRTEAALRSVGDTATRLGARLVVAVVPPAFTMDEATARETFRTVGLDDGTPDLDAAQAAALGAVARAGLRGCDLMPGLRAAAAAGRRPYLPYDGHLSPAGHAVVAETLQACLAAP